MYLMKESSYNKKDTLNRRKLGVPIGFFVSTLKTSNKRGAKCTIFLNNYHLINRMYTNKIAIISTSKVIML